MATTLNLPLLVGQMGATVPDSCFSKKQMALFLFAVYALFKDYKRNSIEAMAKHFLIDIIPYLPADEFPRGDKNPPVKKEKCLIKPDELVTIIKKHYRHKTEVVRYKAADGVKFLIEPIPYQIQTYEEKIGCLIFNKALLLSYYLKNECHEVYSLWILRKQIMETAAWLATFVIKTTYSNEYSSAVLIIGLSSNNRCVSFRSNTTQTSLKALYDKRGTSF